MPDSASVREFARLQIAFAHCLRMTLRKQPQAEVLAHYLKTEDLQRVLASNSPANHILLIMGSGWRFSDAMDNFQISCLLASTIGLMIFQRSWQDASALPIRQFLCLHPDFASHRVSVLYHAAVCAGRGPALHDAFYLCADFLHFYFAGLSGGRTGRSFGNENNDLPLDAICNAIEIDLLQMNDEAEIPAKILPDRHYQLT